MNKSIYVVFSVISTVILMGACFTSAPTQQDMHKEGMGDYKFDTEGNLIRPEGYRKWVYIGTPLTPNDPARG